MTIKKLVLLVALTLLLGIALLSVVSPVWFGQTFLGMKSKEVTESLVDKIQEKEFGDEVMADFIIKHTKKQEHINQLLEAQGSGYRIGSVEVEKGLPPKVTYVIERPKN